MAVAIRTLAWDLGRAALVWAMARRARLAFEALLALPTSGAAPAASTGALPSLSVVVPARDEAASLPRLLASLAALDYPGPLEVVVVDDQSTDETAAIAAGAGARVVRLDGPPQGWAGKPHASHRGAEAARGDWLLFSDADTEHAPDAAARAVRLALARGWDGLSLFPGHAPHGPLDGAALMAAFAGLFAGWPRGRPLLNGQFILIARAAYDRAGGWSAVRGALQDDLALARHLAAQGVVVPALRGPDAVTVRMYADASELWSGLRRIGAGTLGLAGPSALATGLLVGVAALPAVEAALAPASRRPAWRVALSWLAVAAGFLPWARDFGGPRRALLAPVGAAVVAAAATAGVLRRALGGGTTWKGRRV